MAMLLTLWLSLTASSSPSAATPEPAPTLRALAEDLGLQVGFFTSFEPMDPSHEGYDPTFVAALNDTARYEFNLVTAPFYMSRTAPERSSFDFAGANVVVSWAEDNGLAVHGHPLVWHNPGVLPDWVKALEEKEAYAELREALQSHVETLVGTYRGRVSIWDVVNEGIERQEETWGYQDTLWQRAFDDAPPYTYLDRAFAWARASDPDAALIYNDYGVATINPKSDFMFDMVKGMLDRDVPIDGVGFQMHLEGNGAPLNDASGLDSFSRNLRRFAGLGLDIYITEFDTNLRSNTPESLAKQAEVVRGVFNRCVNEPRCKAFQTWGLTDKYTWLDRFNNEAGAKTHPLLFDVQAQPKPAYDAARRALQTLEGRFRLQNRWTERYVNVSTQEVRADVTAYDDKPAWTSQHWQLEPMERGVYRMKNHWGYVLDATGGETVTVTRPNDLWWGQQWYAEYVNGFYRFRNRWTGDYLHAASDTNGAPVLSFASTPEWTSQQWRLEPLTP